MTFNNHKASHHFSYFAAFLIYVFSSHPSYAVTDLNEVRFRISIDAGAIFGYDEIQLIGYATGLNPNERIPFQEPITLHPGETTVTPAMPTAEMASSRDATYMKLPLQVRLIFRLHGNPIFMTNEVTDIMIRVTIATIPLSQVRISAIEPEHAGDPRPSLQFGPSPPPLNLVLDTPFILDLRIMGAIAPMTSTTIPAFILLGRG